MNSDTGRTGRHGEGRLRGYRARRARPGVWPGARLGVWPGVLPGALLVALVLVALPAGAPLRADPSDPIPEGVRRGPVTNLPLPRFVSLKTDKANARRGPGLTHRVDWVFKLRHMPLRVTAEYGNWRRVEDMDGAGGWVHYALLSGVRTVIVQKDYTPLRSAPDVGAPPNAYAEQGVVAFLGKCLPAWCRIRAGGQKGWVLKSEIWGVDPDERRD